MTLGLVAGGVLAVGAGVLLLRNIEPSSALTAGQNGWRIAGAAVGAVLWVIAVALVANSCGGNLLALFLVAVAAGAVARVMWGMDRPLERTCAHTVATAGTVVATVVAVGQFLRQMLQHLLG